MKSDCIDFKLQMGLFQNKNAKQTQLIFLMDKADMPEQIIK